MHSGQGKKVLLGSEGMFPLFCPRFSDYTRTPVLFDHNLFHHSCFIAAGVPESAGLPCGCFPRSQQLFHNPLGPGGWLRV